MITSQNYMTVRGSGFGGAEAREPERPRMLLGAAPATLKCWIEMFEVTNQLVTIDGVEYRKVNSYLSTNFDASTGWELHYNFFPSQERVKDDPFEEVPGFTLNGVEPDHGEENNYVYRSVLYFKTSLSSAIVQAHLSEKQGEEHRSVKYIRKGLLRRNDNVVVTMSDVVTTAVEAENPQTGYIDITTPTDATTDETRVAETLIGEMKTRKAGDEENSQDTGNCLDVIRQAVKDEKDFYNPISEALEGV